MTRKCCAPVSLSWGLLSDSPFLERPLPFRRKNAEEQIQTKYKCRSIVSILSCRAALWKGLLEDTWYPTVFAAGIVKSVSEANEASLRAGPSTSNIDPFSQTRAFLALDIYDIGIATAAAADTVLLFGIPLVPVLIFLDSLSLI